MDDDERNSRLDAWFRAYGDRVLAYLLHRTDHDTAQDVLQEVFVIAARKADTVPEPALGWLFGTARRVLANQRRAQRRRGVLALRIAQDPTKAAAASVEDTVSIRDDEDGPLAEALAAVTAADREVLTLSAWYDLTPDEAAAALGCTPGTYRVRLHRARRRLAARLRAAGHPAADTAASGAAVASAPTQASAEAHNA